jgi:hypothetical protein
LELRNSGIVRIATGCTLNIPCNIQQTASSSAYAITNGDSDGAVIQSTYQGIRLDS